MVSSTTAENFAHLISGSITSLTFFSDFCLSRRLLSGRQFLTNNIKKLQLNKQKTNAIIQKIRTSILFSFVKFVVYKIEQIIKPNVFIILYLNKKLSTKIAYKNQANMFLIRPNVYFFKTENVQNNISFLKSEIKKM